VLVPQPKNESPRLGGPPPSRGEVGQVRPSWGAWRREVGLRTLRRLPSVVVPTGSASCLHSPTDSQAGRRRFDPGRPLL